MLELSLTELKLVAKGRGIKGYNSMPKERLLSAIDKSQAVESKKRLEKTLIMKY